MAERVAVTMNGVRDVHMSDFSGNYATFCGLDGDDPDEHVQQTGTTSTTDRITCMRCHMMWTHARTYRPREFSTSTK